MSARRPDNPDRDLFVSFTAHALLLRGLEGVAHYPKLNVSRNAGLPHAPGIQVGDYIFLSGMGRVDPAVGAFSLELV